VVPFFTSSPPPPPHAHFADQRKRNLPTDERKRNCFLLFVFFQEGPVNSLLEHYFINIKHQDTSLIFYCFPSRRGKKVGWNQWSANAFFIYPVYHLLAALISTLNLLGSVWNWDGFSKAFFFWFDQIQQLVERTFQRHSGIISSDWQGLL